jgi:hypothetical protein
VSKSRYYQATDGEWFYVTRRGYKSMCCSCGHTHHITIRLVDDRIQVKATTDNRATAAARRQFKFTPEDEA